MISADLGKQLESYIQQLVDTGRYGSKSDVLPGRCRKRILDLTQLLALLNQFAGEGERTTLPRLIGNQPALVFRQPRAITFPLFLESGECMLEAGDGPSDVTVTARSIS